MLKMQSFNFFKINLLSEVEIVLKNNLVPVVKQMLILIDIKM